MADAMDTVANEVPGHEVRDHRLPAGGAEGQAEERRAACCSRSTRPATSPATSPASYVKDKGGDQVISSVGGQKIPPVDHYIAGYQAGAKAANPEIKTLNGYSQDFVDQAKCKEIALNQIAQGSQVVFQVAGQCGLGALDAAKEKGVQGIGVDADQGYLGDAHPDLGARRRSTWRCSTPSRPSRTARSRAARTQIFDLKSDGVGLGKLNADGPEVRGPGRQGRAGDHRGKITDIPTRGQVATEPDDRRCPATRPPSSCAGSPSASARSSRTTRSTSSCGAERSTRCSGRTARASRR